MSTPHEDLTPEWAVGRRGPLATRWVLTFPTAEEMTVHVMVASEREGKELVAEIVRSTGHHGEYALEEVPATWECDGRDGCTQQA